MSHVDLVDMIEKSQCEALNYSDEHVLRNCLYEELRDTDAVLQSDCDSELLITVRFGQLVRIHSISLRGPPDRGPANLRVFCNALNLDFDSAKTERCQGEWEGLTAADIGDDAKPLELKYVLFQKVSSITLLITENQEGDDSETVISRLAFIGTPVPNEGGQWQKEQQNQEQASKGDWFGRGNG